MVSLTLKQIEALALQLPHEQRQELIERLNRSLTERESSQRKPIDLAGDWEGRFPEDFDLDAELRDIRSQWNRDDAV